MNSVSTRGRLYDASRIASKIVAAGSTPARGIPPKSALLRDLTRRYARAANAHRKPRQAIDDGGGTWSKASIHLGYGRPSGPSRWPSFKAPARWPYLKGQVTLDEQGHVVGKGDVRAQTRKTLENIQNNPRQHRWEDARYRLTDALRDRHRRVYDDGRHPPTVLRGTVPSYDDGSGGAVVSPRPLGRDDSHRRDSP